VGSFLSSNQIPPWFINPQRGAESSAVRLRRVP
jgi:hypothetical protein